jgi:hypothetical protein
MVPAPSECGITTAAGRARLSQPARFLVSCGFTPDTATRTRTSPIPGEGVSRCPTRNTS